MPLHILDAHKLHIAAAIGRANEDAVDVRSAEISKLKGLRTTAWAK